MGTPRVATRLSPTTEAQHVRMLIYMQCSILNVCRWEEMWLPGEP